MPENFYRCSLARNNELSNCLVEITQRTRLPCLGGIDGALCCRAGRRLLVTQLPQLLCSFKPTLVHEYRVAARTLLAFLKTLPVLVPWLVVRLLRPALRNRCLQRGGQLVWLTRVWSKGRQASLAEPHQRRFLGVCPTLQLGFY